MREKLLVGTDYLTAMTELLQRYRKAYPTHGSFEAAELQFWWRTPRSTDDLGQLFWFDEHGHPVAAVILADFGDGSSLLYEDPTLVIITQPNAEPAWVGHVVERGLAHIAAVGIEEVEIEIDPLDQALRDILFTLGFTVRGAGLAECWLQTDQRPPVSPLSERYQLHSRSEVRQRPHHMTNARRLNPDERFGQLSLYRPDLDLCVIDEHDEIAAYGLFWFDPVTAVGVVEPMRTADDHQRQGLGRHILTAGIARLAAAGADRVAIAFEPANVAASRLYLDVGFVQHRQTDVLVGPTGGATRPRMSS